MAENKREGDLLTHDSRSCVLFLGTCAGSGAADQKPVDFRRMGPKIHRGAASASYQAELLARLKNAVDAEGTDLEKLVLAEGAAPAAAAGHVFLVTCLPADVARKAADVALRIRAGTRHEADGLVLPDAAALVASIDVAPQLRTDLMLFMNEVLVAPAKSAVLAYSTDGTYAAVQRNFPVERAPANADELRAAVAGKPFASCFWCAAPALAEPLKACGRCARVAYCGRECQLKDWAAFHKGGECRGLAKGGDAALACMGPTRAATLRVPTNVSPRLPVDLKPPFDGDVICAYLTNLEDDGSVGPATAPHPLGWHLIPRERWAYEKNKFSYAA
jgi:hypothetical protein